MTGRRIAGILSCLAIAACGGPDTPVDVDLVFQEAEQLLEEGRYRDGLDRMRDAVEARPDDASIQLRYGRTLLAVGQSSLAVWPLSRAIRDPDHLLPAGLLLARAQLLGGSALDAAKTATRVLEAHPESEDALLIRIDAYLAESLEKRALEDLDRLDELTSNPTTAALLRLDALLGLGREEEAAELLTELTTLAESMRDDDPASAARLCTATATFTWERGRTDEAEERFEACLEEHGTGFAILANKAIEFFDATGERERATAIHLARFEANPERLELRVRYADRLQRVGRAEEAERLLHEATKQHPRAWAALADFHAIAGDVEKAVEALDRVIEANPERAESWRFSRADFLLAIGEIDQAEATLASLELPAHRALIEGRIAATRGELDTAAAAFERGIALWPDNPDARYLAAQVYERLGEWRQAAAHYREAARMEEPHYASSLALAELQSALGDMEGVQFLLGRLAERHPQDAEVVERLLLFAWNTGSVELGARMLAKLGRMPGQAGRAAALVARRVRDAEGASAALDALDRAKVDASKPPHYELLSLRVDLLLELDRYDDALAAVARAEARAPDSAPPKVLRARILRARGETDAARAALAAARALDPGHVEAMLDAAALEAEQGHDDRARALYEAAAPLERAAASVQRPNEARATMALARMELAAGEVDAARKRLRALLDEQPRHGEGAWLLYQSYPEGGGLDPEQRTDLVLRASVFAAIPEARATLASLDAEAA